MKLVFIFSEVGLSSAILRACIFLAAIFSPIPSIFVNIDFCIFKAPYVGNLTLFVGELIDFLTMDSA